MNIRRIYWVYVAAVLLAASCAKEPGFGDGGGNEAVLPAVEDCVDGELLVKFDPAMTEILDKLVPGPATKSGIPSADEVLEILGAYSLERVFPVDRRHEARTREAGLHLWYLVKFPEGTDLAAAMADLGRLGEISMARTNRLLYRNPSAKPVMISAEQLAASDVLTKASSAVSSGTFNDPGLRFQWGYVNKNVDFGTTRGQYGIDGCDVGCEDAWKKCTGDPSIIVAVLDEGVMVNHPDLEANIWTNEDEDYGSENDNDGNGYAGDRHGYNFVRNMGTIHYGGIYDIGHGTHVAGTIAAVNGNGKGVCGVAGGDGTPNSGVKIMSCQIFDNGYTCTLANEVRAMKYAADNGAVILQCSWGYNSHLSNPLSGYTPGPATEKEWSDTYPLEKEAIDYFLHNAGSPNGVIDGGLVIVASGNEYAGMSAFPAAYSGCISVGAICADYTPASYTNYGSEIELSAPGGDREYHCSPGMADDEITYVLNGKNDPTVGPLQLLGGILSTVSDGINPAYCYYEGTSMSCPAVAGVAALGLSYAAKLHRHFTAGQFRELLVSTAASLDDIYRGRTEWKYYYNHTSPGYSTTKLSYSTYIGKMGRLAKADRLLDAIDGTAGGGMAGVPMRLPNFYLAPGEKNARTIDLAAYYDETTYTAVSADSAVAAVAVEGTRMTVTGVREGITKVTVTAGGSKVTVTVTVRENAGSAGWL